MTDDPRAGGEPRIGDATLVAHLKDLKSHGPYNASIPTLALEALIRDLQDARREAAALRAELAGAGEREARLEGALEWYADRRNYRADGRPGNQQMRSTGKSVFWRADMGDRARAALGEGKDA